MINYGDRELMKQWKDRVDAAKLLADYFDIRINILDQADSSDPTYNRKQLWIDGVKIVDKEQ